MFNSDFFNGLFDYNGDGEMDELESASDFDAYMSLFNDDYDEDDYDEDDYDEDDYDEDDYDEDDYDEDEMEIGDW